MNAPEPIPFKVEGPQPLVRETPPGEAFPVHALGPLRAVVEAVAGEVQAPTAIPAASALAVASLAVQGFADVEALGSARPVSLFALTIAQSGERKSTCDAMLMAGLRDHEKGAWKAHGREAQAWANAQALWRGDRDKALSDAKNAKRSEGRAEAETRLAGLGPEPAAPTVPDRTVSEPTHEGLTRKFAEGMPSLGLFSDEGGMFLGGFAMNTDNRQKTLAALNKLWDGAAIQRTRQGDGHQVLYGRRLALHLMAQPGVARAFMADPVAADIGFLPRCLICEPLSTIGTRLAGRVRFDRQAIDAFADRLRAILETAMPMEPETRALEPRTLPLSPEARALLIRFADAVEAAQAPGGEYAGLTGAASKAAEQAARISGVLTLWGDLDAPEVSAETMADGITLAQFYLGEALRLVDAATVSDETAKAERLRLWLADWPHAEVTPSEILNRGPNALRERPALAKPLGILVSAGWLEPLEAGAIIRGKARREAYRIVRAGHAV